MTHSKDPQQADLRQRLRSEAQAPYRGLRRVFYGLFAASGLMGGFILSLKWLAGTAPADVGWSLALQVGVVAVMVALWRWDQPRSPQRSSGTVPPKIDPPD
ncbi:DUF3493 domain-containing protein [Parathermosynechococcus lividus]|nr:DUF3493 domain-containing protein [Synechococcus sp. PCC 6716]